MSMTPLQRLRSSGRRLVVVHDQQVGVPMVYAIQRVGSPEFLRLAMLALGTSHQEASEAEDLRYRQLGATPEQAAQIAAEVEAAAEAKKAKLQAEVMADPERLAALLAAPAGLVRASVVALGIGRTDLAEPLGEGLLPATARPEDICEPIGEGRSATYLQAVRWTESGTPDGPDTLSISAIGDRELMVLAALISEAFSPTKADRAIFPGSGAARDGAPVGKGVRAPPKRARGVRGSGDGGGVRSGGARGR